MRAGLSPMLGLGMLPETMGFYAFRGFLSLLNLGLSIAPKSL